ncbi:MAG: FAD/NAD(P)-binding protein [Balneolaceae bacterium]
MEERKIIRKVAIIGGGPKGIYGFERLAAWLKIQPPSERTEIHVFNRSNSFGAGENYRIEQPSWLLMNNPAGDLNMWGEELPCPVVPKPLSFPEWLRYNAGIKISNNDYATRSMAGRYLSYGFNLIASSLPENVDGKYIVGEVVDLYNDSGKYSICLKAGGDENYPRQTDRYDHVLLATGHPRHRESKQELIFQSFAHEHGKVGYIPFVYPAETVFSNVSPNCSVAIKGMGLTFVDAVLALTEGKGGRFERDSKTDTLLYKPSGDEPKAIFPFSRSGLPMIPRRSVPHENNELLFFNSSALQRCESNKKFDFKQQIWPLLRQDMIYAYYDIAIKNAGYPEGLSGCDVFEDVEHVIAEYHKKESSEIRFDVESFLNPLKETDLEKCNTYHQYIDSLYSGYLQEARKGELNSPLAAVTAVWRKASSLYCEVYAFGGLTPDSHRDFDCSVRGKLNRVTFGPPVKNAEKLYALMESGILNFDAARNPELVLDEKSGLFVLVTRFGGTRYPVQCLVDARIPKVSLVDDPGPLFRNLLNRGLITIYENKSGKEVYQPGAVNITHHGFVIGKNGAVNRGIALTGTPTEGITFDNDTLSRDRNNFVDRWAECISRVYAEPTHEEYVY